MIRRLDHVAVVVRDTEEALRHFRDRLGLRPVHVDTLEQPAVRLTYLDAGNAYVQLVQPLDETSAIAQALARDGEGIHHLCFGADDPVADAAALADEGTPPAASGRGRVSAFVPGEPTHGVLVECTAFDYGDDVARTPGWLAGDADARAGHQAGTEPHPP